MWSPASFGLGSLLSGDRLGAPGFDDAPLIGLRQAAHARTVTYVYPYYENPRFFARQLRIWNAYPPELREYLRVIVVDDGSPNSPAVEVVKNTGVVFDLRLFRIGVDVRWNWLAARNIGMHYARGWCLMTDMDHVVPENTLRAVMFGALRADAVYRFCRREADGKKIHPHPNSMAMTRETFWQLGGYDEALSGHYGTDGDWRRRCAAGAPCYTLPLQLERHEYVTDSSTTHYLRKQPQDAGKKAIVAKRRPGWKPKTLSFPYAEVDIA